MKQQASHEHKNAAKPVKKPIATSACPPPWIPDWRWHLKTLSVIYVLLIIGFFAAKHFLAKLEPPYNIRRIPSAMTPWLNPKNYPEP